VERRRLEIAGLESRSGLIMGDFVSRISGREGRRPQHYPVNVRFSAFHEGRGAGKTDPPGGHRLVNEERIVSEKERFRKDGWGKGMLIFGKGMACWKGVGCRVRNGNLVHLCCR
jgi:hypothetical protein